jgi:hypothetical protein
MDMSYDRLLNERMNGMNERIIGHKLRRGDIIKIDVTVR